MALVSNPRRERVLDMFPEVLLAVLGIMQALALELLWDEGVGGLGRWREAGALPAGVLQVVAMFLGVVVVWVMYASMVLRFRWMPRFRDLVVPFVLGVSEFLLVELMAPARLALWFAGMAAVFAMAMTMTFETFRSAILAHEVEGPPLREQLWSYAPGAAALVGLLACALLARRFGPDSPVSLATLALANAGLLGQLAVFRAFWQSDLVA